jgi:hypothetical protein
MEHLWTIVIVAGAAGVVIGLALHFALRGRGK